MKVALGTAQFGMPYGVANRSGQITPAAATEMLRYAAASGIDMLDTAASYGTSEACLGKAGVEGFRLVTKLSAHPDGLEETEIATWAEREMRSSLDRLGVSDCYGLLLHRPGQLLGQSGQELYRSLQSLKERGYVSKIGVSIYGPDELEAILPRYPVDIVQVPVNVLDRRLDVSGWEGRLKDLGVEIHARSVFLQGLLLLRREEIPQRFSPWFPVLDEWHRWLAESGLTALEACLTFLARRESVDRIVVGADGLNQLEEIVTALRGQTSCEAPKIACDDEHLINPSCWPH